MTSKRTVGITIGDPARLWNSGIHQNAHILAVLLEKVGYKVVLISDIDRKGSNHYDTVGLKTIVDDRIRIDILLTVSSWLPVKTMNHLKESFGTKFISIQYGNYFETFQECLFHEKKFAMVSPLEKNIYCDELWISPHFEYSSPFLQSVHPSLKIKTCPYIWNEEGLMARASLTEGNPYFDQDNNIKKVTIHEPNISYMKNCFIPLCITSRSRSLSPTSIETLSIFNVNHLTANKDFIQLISALNLQDIVGGNKRYSIPWLASKKLVGTPVMHQRNCELNYMHLEFMHLGYPVVHNCAPFKDAGYFYEGINIETGALKLIEAVETHRSNLKEYNERSKKVIWKYHSDNPKNIQGYVKLIEEVLG